MRTFIGTLAWDRKTQMSSSDFVNQVFPEGVSYYFLAANFKQQWREESRLCQLHGMRYEIYELPSTWDRADTSAIWRVRVKKSQIEHTKISFVEYRAESALAFAQQNESYLRQLNALLSEYSIGADFLS